MSPTDIWTIVIGVAGLAAIGWAEGRDDVPPSVPNALGAATWVAIDALRGFPSLDYTAAAVLLFLGSAAVRHWTERRAGEA